MAAFPQQQVADGLSDGADLDRRSNLKCITAPKLSTTDWPGGTGSKNCDCMFESLAVFFTLCDNALYFVWDSSALRLLHSIHSPIHPHCLC